MMKNSGHHTFKVHIDKNHPACDGHFEGNPLLPGVVTLEYVRLAVKEFYPLQRIKEFKKVKFTHSLKPGETLVINLSIMGGHSMAFQCLDSQEHQIAIGNLDLQ